MPTKHQVVMRAANATAPECGRREALRAAWRILKYLLENNDPAWNNGNGKRNIIAPKPTDDLAAILAQYPDLDTHVSRAKFLFHALLCNVGRNLLELLELYAEKGTVKRFNAESLCQFVLDSYDPREELPDNEVIVNDVIEEARKLWTITATLLRPFIMEQQTQALIYKELADEELDIEDVKLDDVITIWPERRIRQ